MIEVLLIPFAVWCLLITWAVGNLYTRPAGGLDADDIDLIKDFMENVRKLARAERRRGGKC